jgi:glycosyltransferase involved in cell wall biosynthesis
MHALVVAPTLPPRPGLDMSGVYRRHRLFMQALAAVADRIDVLHLVPPALVAAREAATLDPGELDREQSAYWGCPVSVSLVPRRSRRETFRAHYLAGLLSAAGQPHFHPFAGPEQGAAVRRHLERDPDLVLVLSLPAMLAVLASGVRPRRLFFDLDDVQHRVRLRACLQPPATPGKLAYLAHVPALMAAERRGARLASQSFVCSELDRRHLARCGIARNVTVVPNAVAAPAEPPPLGAEPTLLFLGACHYRPNVEAAERLARRILPLVRRQVPQARLLLAGEGSERLAFGDAAGVEPLGFVADLGGLYARSRVVCAPLANGGGTRVKLVEAAAYARPMVATHVGAEGLAFADGEHVLLHDRDADIAAACVRLLQDDALASRLGRAARAQMQRLYQAGDISERLARLLAVPAPAM